MALDGTLQHRKTTRLARELRVPPWAALGLLEGFWAYCRRSAKAGRIEEAHWEAVADYLRYEGGPASELRDVLVKAGFVDVQDGWYWVHDWHLHADNTLRKKLERESACFANGSPVRRPRGGSEEQPADSAQVAAEGDFPKQPVWEKTFPKVPDLGSLRGGAQPEPEPEPGPEPAAAVDAPERPRALAAAEAVAEAMKACMPPGRARPTAEQVRKVVAAAGGDALGVVDYLRVAGPRWRARPRPPRDYALLWQIVESEFGEYRREARAAEARRREVAAEEGARAEAAQREMAEQADIDRAVDVAIEQRRREGRLASDLAGHGRVAERQHARSWGGWPASLREDVAMGLLRQELRAQIVQAGSRGSGAA